MSLSLLDVILFWCCQSIKNFLAELALEDAWYILFVIINQTNHNVFCPTVLLTVFVTATGLTTIGQSLDKNINKWIVVNPPAAFSSVTKTRLIRLYSRIF